MVRKGGNAARVSRKPAAHTPAPPPALPFGALGVGGNGINGALKRYGIEECPQCQTGFNQSNCRPVQDSCGHFKCRVCFISNEDGCSQCKEAQKPRQRKGGSTKGRAIDGIHVENVNGTAPSDSPGRLISTNVGKSFAPLSKSGVEITDTNLQSSLTTNKNISNQNENCRPSMELSSVTELGSSCLDSIYPGTSNLEGECRELPGFSIHENLLHSTSYSSIINQESEFSKSLMSLRKAAEFQTNDGNALPNCTRNNYHSVDSSSLECSYPSLVPLGSTERGLITRAQVKEFPESQKPNIKFAVKRKQAEPLPSPVQSPKVVRFNPLLASTSTNSSVDETNQAVDTGLNCSRDPKQISLTNSTSPNKKTQLTGPKFFRHGASDRESLKNAAIANSQLGHAYAGPIKGSKIKTEKKRSSIVPCDSSKNKCERVSKPPRSKSFSPNAPLTSQVEKPSGAYRKSEGQASHVPLSPPTATILRPKITYGRSSLSKLKVTSSTKSSIQDGVSTVPKKQDSSSSVLYKSSLHTNDEVYNAFVNVSEKSRIHHIPLASLTSIPIVPKTSAPSTSEQRSELLTVAYTDICATSPSALPQATLSAKSSVKLENSVESKDKKKKKRNPVIIHDHITVISGDPTMFQCNVCEKKFKTKAHIKYHEFCQNGKKPFNCEQCGQGFIAKSHYEYHLRTHTGERPYVCEKCGKGFNQRGKVTRHMRSHTGEKPFICSECGRGFANAQALRSHHLIHTGERPFACKYCQKRFTGMTNLKKHIITHTGERPYVCTHCGKSFGLKWTLDLHLRTHSSERPYACDQCSRAFSNSKDLRRHLVIHSGERPFKCWICGTAFRRKDNLDRHIKNTHNQPKEVAKQLANEAAAEYLASTKSAPVPVSKVNSAVISNVIRTAQFSPISDENPGFSNTTSSDTGDDKYNIPSYKKKSKDKSAPVSNVIITAELSPRRGMDGDGQRESESYEESYILPDGGSPPMSEPENKSEENVIKEEEPDSVSCQYSTSEKVRVAHNRHSEGKTRRRSCELSIKESCSRNPSQNNEANEAGLQPPEFQDEDILTQNDNEQSTSLEYPVRSTKDHSRSVNEVHRSHEIMDLKNKPDDLEVVEAAKPNENVIKEEQHVVVRCREDNINELTEMIDAKDKDGQDKTGYIEVVENPALCEVPASKSPSNCTEQIGEDDQTEGVPTLTSKQDPMSNVKAPSPIMSVEDGKILHITAEGHMSIEEEALSTAKNDSLVNEVRCSQELMEPTDKPDKFEVFEVTNPIESVPKEEQPYSVRCREDNINELATMIDTKDTQDKARLIESTNEIFGVVHNQYLQDKRSSCEPCSGESRSRHPSENIENIEAELRNQEFQNQDSPTQNDCEQSTYSESPVINITKDNSLVNEVHCSREVMELNDKPGELGVLEVANLNENVIKEEQQVSVGCKEDTINELATMIDTKDTQDKTRLIESTNEIFGVVHNQYLQDKRSSCEPCSGESRSRHPSENIENIEAELQNQEFQNQDSRTQNDCEQSTYSESPVMNITKDNSLVNEVHCSREVMELNDKPGELGVLEVANLNENVIKEEQQVSVGCKEDTINELVEMVDTKDDHDKTRCIDTVENPELCEENAFKASTNDTLKDITEDEDYGTDLLSKDKSTLLTGSLSKFMNGSFRRNSLMLDIDIVKPSSSGTDEKDISSKSPKSYFERVCDSYLGGEVEEDDGNLSSVSLDENMETDVHENIQRAVETSVNTLESLTQKLNSEEKQVPLADTVAPSPIMSVEDGELLDIAAEGHEPMSHEPMSHEPMSIEEGELVDGGDRGLSSISSAEYDYEALVETQEASQQTDPDFSGEGDHNCKVLIGRPVSILLGTNGKESNETLPRDHTRETFGVVNTSSEVLPDDIEALSLSPCQRPSAADLGDDNIQYSGSCKDASLSGRISSDVRPSASSVDNQDNTLLSNAKESYDNGGPLLCTGNPESSITSPDAHSGIVFDTDCEEQMPAYDKICEPSDDETPFSEDLNEDLNNSIFPLCIAESHKILNKNSDEVDEDDREDQLDEVEDDRENISDPSDELNPDIASYEASATDDEATTGEVFDTAISPMRIAESPKILNTNSDEVDNIVVEDDSEKISDPGDEVNGEIFSGEVSATDDEATTGEVVDTAISPMRIAESPKILNTNSDEVDNIVVEDDSEKISDPGDEVNGEIFSGEVSATDDEATMREVRNTAVFPLCISASSKILNQNSEEVDEDNSNGRFDQVKDDDENISNPNTEMDPEIVSLKASASDDENTTEELGEVFASSISPLCNAESPKILNQNSGAVDNEDVKDDCENLSDPGNEINHEIFSCKVGATDDEATTGQVVTAMSPLCIAESPKILNENLDEVDEDIREGQLEVGGDGESIFDSGDDMDPEIVSNEPSVSDDETGEVVDTAISPLRIVESPTILNQNTSEIDDDIREEHLDEVDDENREDHLDEIDDLVREGHLDEGEGDLVIDIGDEVNPDVSYEDSDDDATTEEVLDPPDFTLNNSDSSEILYQNSDDVDDDVRNDQLDEAEDNRKNVSSLHNEIVSCEVSATEDEAIAHEVPYSDTPNQQLPYYIPGNGLQFYYQNVDGQQPYEISHCPSQLQFSYPNFVPQEGDNPGNNLGILYAAAAATAERNDDETGPPVKVRLLYAEAVGVRGTDHSDQQLFYTSTTPNQEVETSGSSRVQLGPPAIIYPPLNGNMPMVDRLQYSYIQNPPRVPEPPAPYPVQVSYNNGMSHIQTITDHPDTSRLLKRARDVRHLLPQEVHHYNYNLPAAYMSQVFDQPYQSSQGSQESRLYSNSPNGYSSMSDMQYPDANVEFDPLRSLAAEATRRLGFVSQEEGDATMRAAAAIALVGEAARKKRQEEQFQRQRESAAEIQAPASAPPMPVPPSRSPDRRINRGPRKNYLSQPSYYGD